MMPSESRKPEIQKVEPGQPGYWLYRVLTTPMRVEKRRRHINSLTKVPLPRKA
jgi:hypothetical protein